METWRRNTGEMIFSPVCSKDMVRRQTSANQELDLLQKLKLI